MTNPLIRDAERRAAGASELDRQFKLGDQDFSCAVLPRARSQIAKVLDLLDNLNEGLRGLVTRAERENLFDAEHVGILTSSSRDLETIGKKLRSIK